MSFAPAAVVPVYNHPHRLDDVVATLRAQNLPVILVDDGSDAATAAVIDAVAARDGVHLERLDRNHGKGEAVLLGLAAAERLAYTHALQVDADGQHDLACVPRLLDEARRHPDALISGKPRYDDSVPKSRLYGRYLTHVWVWIETLSLGIVDSMCGFRVYPVRSTLAVAREEHVGRRMDFDTEIMVRLYWRGVHSRFVPVRVNYPEDGVSHFDVWADNWRISRMHTRLVFGMLRRLPRLLRNRLSGRRPNSSWARQTERGSFAGMRLLAFLARVFGKAPVRAMLHPVTLYFLIVHGAARRASRDYLQRVNTRVAAELHEATRPTARNLYRHFLAFSHAVLEKLQAWQAPERLPAARLHGGALLDEVARRGRGMLFLSAHLGNLEMCRALARNHPGLKVNALVYTRNARKFAALMESVNPEFRDRLILVEHVGADTAVQLRTLIERGEIVVMVGDRTPASENGRVVSADFLGAPAPFATGPYVLAHLLDCEVGLMLCLRGNDGGYDIHIEPFAERVRLPRNVRQAALQEYAARFAARLEHYVTRHPLQWFNFYDFWNARAGQAPVRDGEIAIHG